MICPGLPPNPGFHAHFRLDETVTKVVFGSWALRNVWMFLVFLTLPSSWSIFRCLAPFFAIRSMGDRQIAIVRPIGRILS